MADFAYNTRMTSLILQAGAGSLPRLMPHTNAGLEIVFVRRGHLLWQTEGRVEPVPPGAVYFTLPGQVHGSATEFEPGHEWVYVIFATGRRSLLHPGLGFTQVEARRIEALLRGAKRHAHADGASLGWLLQEIVREHDARAGFREDKLAGLARAAVAELARQVAEGVAPRTPAVRDAARERVRCLVTHIAEGPGERRTLAAMAAACRLGRTQFTRLLREQTGDGPTRFLHRLRVREACRLLRETEWPVTRIAHACGFGTSQYFAQIFRRMTGGLTAQSYRRLSRAGPVSAATPRAPSPRNARAAT